jgi:hypothetical protein
MSWRIACVLTMAGLLGWSSPSLAQTRKKDDKTGEKSDATASSGDKPEDKKKDEGDVVFDNTGMAKKKQIEKQQADEGKYENDTPFAKSAPDPVALRAQRWKPGIGGGYRLGWAFPSGAVERTYPLGEGVKGMIFLWADVGYWPIPQLFVGLDVSGGYVLPKCTGNASCWGLDVRGGPEVLARFLPFEDVSPMLGLGFGYEYLMLKGSTEVSSLTEKYRGFELLNLQAGIDVRSRGDFYGLFLFYSFGKFDKYSRDREDTTGALPSSSSSGDISETATHHWIGIGARGTLE